MRDFEGLLFGTDGINCHNARLRSVQVGALICRSSGAASYIIVSD